jgi:hypothetical protein
MLLSEALQLVANREPSLILWGEGVLGEDEPVDPIGTFAALDGEAAAAQLGRDGFPIPAARKVEEVAHAQRLAGSGSRGWLLFLLRRLRRSAGLGWVLAFHMLMFRPPLFGQTLHQELVVPHLREREALLFRSERSLEESLLGSF